MDALAEIDAFLPCPTPEAWLVAAPERIDVLLVDHANCEKKAAATALGLAHRYTDDLDLLDRMSRLAREELRHFEQVLAIIRRRGYAYPALSAARYAAGLHRAIRAREPARRVDTLLVGALIEARSCERFARLVPRVDDELGAFYASLLKSESRHYRAYLALAARVADADEIASRLDALREVERDLIESPDATFRFHSGVPG